jgi:two-component system response regulator AtoC
MEISDEALRSLTEYDWPGNVRELEHSLTRAVVLTRGPLVMEEHLPLDGGAFTKEERSGREARPRTLAEAEALHVQGILDETEGNKRKTARILDVSRARLERMIGRHGLRV